MGVRAEVQRKIDRKLQEISVLEAQIRDARIYVQALEDAMKLLPREEPTPGRGDSGVLKPGSAIAAARDAIRKAGRPLHISEILAAVGRPNDPANRAAIGGSIAAYVRREAVFTRPRPNTFGLVEMNGAHPEASRQPPPEFGKD